MEKIMQRVEEFYASGTFAAKEGERTLEGVIRRVNSEGWKVDQVIPTSFGPSKYLTGGMEVSSGIILCSKIE